MKKYLQNNRLPLVVALISAILFVTWYTVSGRASLDQNIRNLSNTAPVQKVDATNPKEIVVNCKNGQSYKIAFDKEVPDYKDLIFNACGDEGTQER